MPTSTVSLTRVVAGFTSPLGMAIPNDDTGRLFIVDQVGQIYILDAAGELNDVPFLDIADRLVDVGIDFGDGFIFDERGLLGLAFHPNYAENGRFFVCYNTPKRPDDPEEFDSRVRVSEFRESGSDPNRADATSERILLEVLKPQFNHNGGQLAFGPDGYLFISIGDGGNANDVGPGHTPEIGNAQDRTTLLGKILRIDVDRGDPYAIPPDNPFADDPPALPEIWAFGLRNPFRFSFDTAGARRLFIGDVGQDLTEEVDIGTHGGNYGWHIREGGHCFDPAAPASPPEECADQDLDGAALIAPIIEYPHVSNAGEPVGLSVIGGYVYRGTAIPGLVGSYIFGDFSTRFDVADGTLFAASEASDGTWTFRELAVPDRQGGRIGRFVLGFGQDRQGEVYVLTTMNAGPVGKTGEVYRLAPAP